MTALDGLPLLLLLGVVHDVVDGDDVPTPIANVNSLHSLQCS